MTGTTKGRDQSISKETKRNHRIAKRLFEGMVKL